MIARWRLIASGPARGRINMAVDEALLDGMAAARDPTPVLRLYGWEPAALSLGRNQPASSSHDPRFLEREAIELVRRPSGGLAVLHEHERTFAVIAPLRLPPFDGGVVRAYRTVAGALVRGLTRLGVPARAHPVGGARPAGRSGGADCFGELSGHEIGVGGRKLIGGAQLRRRGAFLLHGSILQRASAERLAAALGCRVDGSRFTDLEREIGPVSDETLDAALVSGFEEAFACRLERSELDPAEREAATRLEHERYGTEAWTYRRA